MGGGGYRHGDTAPYMIVLGPNTIPTMALRALFYSVSAFLFLTSEGLEALAIAGPQRYGSESKTLALQQAWAAILRQSFVADGGVLRQTPPRQDP